MTVSLSYPKYPQPILKQAGTGRNWWLEVTKAGVLQAVNTTLDAPTQDPRVTLVTTDRTKSYRLGLDGSTPPLVTLTQMPDATYGGYEDLFVFSPNGREWAVQANSAGTLTVRTMGSSWKTQPAPPPDAYPPGTAPLLQDSQNQGWALTVADPGIYRVTSGGPPVDGLKGVQPITLRSEDDAAAYTVTVDGNGILSVNGPLPIASSPEVYGLQLTAPGGNVYLLTVDANGILYIDTALQDAINARDEWTVVFAKNNTIFYVVDERFRPPVPGFQGRYGWRSRRY